VSYLPFYAASLITLSANGANSLIKIAAIWQIVAVSNSDRKEKKLKKSQR